MPKLRKMLGNADGPECAALMRLMETQSAGTLASWAVGRAGECYLPVYEDAHPGDLRLRETLSACASYLEGGKKLAEVKPAVRAAGQIARDTEEPAAQAAARAVSTACAAVQTPTNALGFLFYGAAAVAYSSAGLDETADTYDGLAAKEFRQAYDSLKSVSVSDEPHPAKIRWYCT